MGPKSALAEIDEALVNLSCEGLGRSLAADQLMWEDVLDQTLF